MEVPSYEFDTIIEKNARKKYLCQMCQEVIILATKINCNHRFCKYCITKWMAYFNDCPVCRQKISQVAPHPRTDKWITQLYDLATPDYRQDREMCINYRKLQQSKMELVGVEDVSCNIRINREQLLEEFGLKSSDLAGGEDYKGAYEAEIRLAGAIPVSDQQKRELEKPNVRFNVDVGEDSGDKIEFPLSPVARQDSTMKSLYFQKHYTRKTIPSVSELTEMFNRPHDFSKGVTQLFGATSPTTFADTVIQGSTKYDCRFTVPETDTDHPILSPSHETETRNSRETLLEKPTLSSHEETTTNSDQTYALHYPGNSQPSRLLTLAELTCHDDLVMVNDDDEELEELSGGQRTTGTNKVSNNQGMGGGDTMLSDPRLVIRDMENPSEIVQSLNAVKAETMRARIQHEIAKAMMPSMPPLPKQNPSRGDCTGGPAARQSNSNSQREQQDLQTCREALLNLRLRLVPPAKRNEPLSSARKEKRIVSDSKFPLNTGAHVNVHKLCSVNVSKRESFKQVKEMMKDTDLLPKKYRSIQKMESIGERENKSNPHNH